MFSSSRTRATEPPTPPCLEIGERQGEQVPEEACPELDIDPVRRMREQIDAKPAHDRFEESDADKADDENVKRGLGSVHEDLVDHHLEEQGGRLQQASYPVNDFRAEFLSASEPDYSL